jgi:hypothetical protein
MSGGSNRLGITASTVSWRLLAARSAASPLHAYFRMSGAAACHMMRSQHQYLKRPDSVEHLVPNDVFLLWTKRSQFVHLDQVERHIADARARTRLSDNAASPIRNRNPVSVSLALNFLG